MIDYVVKILNRFNYSQKLTLIFTVFLVSLLTMFCLFFYRLNKDIGFVKKERLGIKYIVPLAEIIQDVQKHRGMNSALLGGDVSFKDRLSDQKREINEKLAKMSEMNKKLGIKLNSAEKFNNVKSDWDELNKKLAYLEGSGAKTESFNLHTALLAEILDLIEVVRDNSNLAFDSQADSYYLQSTLVQVLLPALESCGQSRAFGVNLLASKAAANEAEKRKFASLFASVKSGLDGIINGMGRVYNYNPDIKRAQGGILESGTENLRNFVETIYATFVSENAEKTARVTPAEFFAISTKSIDEGYKFFYETAPLLDSLLTERINANSLIRNIALVISAISGFLIVMIFIGFHRSLTGGLSQMQNIADKIANGDLKQKEIEINSNDEIGQFGAIFNKMIASLKEIASRADLIAQGTIRADEVETKLQAGKSLEDAARVSSGESKGDLDEAFNRMQAQLRKLAIQARLIANGDLNNKLLDLKIPGDLGEAFEQMTVTLRAMARYASQIAQGDLKVNITVRSDKDVVAGAFAQMQLNLNAFIAKVKEQANMLASSSSTLAQISEQSSQTVAQLSSTISQISASTSSVAQSSQNASSASQSADTSINSGKALMTKLVEKINLVMDVEDKSASAMSGLLSGSEKIGAIVSVITKIADQTNLLSLNAAIEAARAGESGRGFAVVADEVRKLAESSASSAQEIAGIIKNVQEETKSASESVQKGKKEIEDGSRLTVDSNNRFTEIAAQIENITHQIEEIASSAEESAASSEEAAASSEEQAASMEEIASTAANLAASAKVLLEAIDKFKV